MLQMAETPNHHLHRSVSPETLLCRVPTPTTKVINLMSQKNEDCDDFHVPKNSETFFGFQVGRLFSPCKKVKGRLGEKHVIEGDTRVLGTGIKNSLICLDFCRWYTPNAKDTSTPPMPPMSMLLLHDRWQRSSP